MDEVLELLQLGAAVVVVAVSAVAAGRAAAVGPTALAAFVAGWRSDPWPKGVQEDDDFRWDWPASNRDEADAPVDLETPATERLRPAVRVRDRR